MGAPAVPCTFVDHPLNDGVDMMTCQVRVERLQVVGAGDKGVSIGEDSHPEISDSSFKECVTGLGIKDGSDPLIRDCVIEGCKTAVASYDKNWRYPGGGHGRLLRCTLKGNSLDVRLDKESTLSLDHCQTDGKFELPKKLAPGQFVMLPPPEGTP